MSSEIEENDIKDIKMVKQEPTSDESTPEENDVMDVNSVKQEPTVHISSCTFMPKRKIADETQTVKLVKQEPLPNMSYIEVEELKPKMPRICAGPSRSILESYIEQERENWLEKSDTAEDVEAFLYQSTRNSSSGFERLRRVFDRGVYYNARNMNNFHPEIPQGYMVTFHPAIQPQYRFIQFNTGESASSQIRRPRIIQAPTALTFNLGRRSTMNSNMFDSADNGDPLSSWVYEQTSEQLYRDSLWGKAAKIDDSPSLGTVCENTLITQLIVILRDWSIPMYHKCIFDYKIVRKEKPQFWDKIFVKVFSYAMLQYQPDARLVASFFYTMCKYCKPITPLVKIKSCYLHFFLMNISAINGIDFPMIINSEKWSLKKHELIERAFVSGEFTNLKLLLQYFQPNRFWSNDDMEFLKAPTTDWETRLHNIDNIASGYYGRKKLILLNLVRLGAFVSESTAEKKVLAESIRLLWRASKEPFVTREDIEDAFRPLDISLLLRHQLIRACKSVLLEVYPADCFAEYKPRSLMHLSRCAVRRQIISAAYVSDLHLPDKLKQYVNLDW